MATLKEAEQSIEVELFRNAVHACAAHFGFSDSGFGDGPILITAPPGTGKSYQAAQMVNLLFDGFGIASITLVLAYEQMEVVDGREGWHKWQGHSRMCSEARRSQAVRNLGYNVTLECDCDYASQFEFDEPTLAVLDYLIGMDTVALQYGYEGRSNVPLFRPEIRDFNLRIVDEVVLSRFVGSQPVSDRDLRIAAREHPDSQVRMLSAQFRELRDTTGDLKWLSGQPMYQSLETGLNERSTSLQEFRDDLADVELPTTVWSDGPQPPTNFPPYLFPILKQELEWLEEGRPFNPRIHVNTGADSPAIEIRYRRFVDCTDPIVIMDATADPSLVHKVFGVDRPTPKPTPVELPKSVTVLQLSEDRLGSGTLNLFPSVQPKANRQKWYEELRLDLENQSRDRKVGVVTLRAIEDELVGEVHSLGYEDVKSLHYGNLRSMNTMVDRDILILFGCPGPHPDSLQREAQAFFFDEPPLDISWVPITEHLITRDGREIPVSLRAYGNDDRLQSYYMQSCQAELYQAFHRSRPNRVIDGREQTIMIYTHVPISDVRIDGFLGKMGRVAKALAHEVASRGACKTAQLAELTPNPAIDQDSNRRWIDRNRLRLAQLAGVQWDAATKRFRTFPI